MKKKFHLSSKSIVLIIILGIVFVYCFSQLTSYLVIKEISNTVSKYEIMSMDFEDMPEYLQKLGYNVELNENQTYDTNEIIAIKDDEKLTIYDGKDSYVCDYTFEYTSSDITPLISNVEWNDSKATVKRKMGINLFNTRFHSLKIGETAIVNSDDFIIVKADKNCRYAYSLDFDDSKRLYRVNITRYYN